MEFLAEIDLVFVQEWPPISPSDFAFVWDVHFLEKDEVCLHARELPFLVMSVWDLLPMYQNIKW